MDVAVATVIRCPEDKVSSNELHNHLKNAAIGTPIDNLSPAAKKKTGTKDDDCTLAMEWKDAA